MVEDEAALAEAIGRGLRHEGMAVDLASDGAEALDKVAFTRYDVVVLDRDLPRVHGDQVCKTLVKQGSSSRVLMLTASGGVEDRIDGLTMGADDYLPKPFVFQELVARIRSLGRRSAEPLRPILTHGDLTLDPARRVVTRQGRYLSLSNKEFSVLEILMAFPGRVVSAEELWRGLGMRTPTRSPTPSGSPSPTSAASSVNRR